MRTCDQLIEQDWTAETSKNANQLPLNPRSESDLAADTSLFPFHVAVQRSSEENVASTDQKSTLTRIEKNDHQINQEHLCRWNNFRNSSASLQPRRLGQSFLCCWRDVKHHTSSRTLVVHAWQILAESWNKCPVTAGKTRVEQKDQLESSVHWSIFCVERKVEYTQVLCTGPDRTYKKQLNIWFLNMYKYKN